MISLATSLEPAHNVRTIALVWPTDSPSLPRDKFHALCASRIVARGQNHQTLRAGEDHEAIIWGFLGQHEAFDPATNSGDGKFDHVIEMRAEWDQVDALQHVVAELAKIDGVLPADTQVPLPQPRVDEAIAHARGWKTTVRKESSAAQRNKPAGGARYYGISATVDLKKLVEQHLHAAEQAGGSGDDESLWYALVKASRVERKPHVTLVHRNELEHADEGVRAQKKALWERYEALVDEAVKTSAGPARLEVELTLGPRLVFDSRAMAIEVSGLTSKAAGDAADRPQIALTDGKSAHITVGTRSSDIRPVEGKFLMETVSNGGNASKEGGEIRVVDIGKLQVPGKLAGLS